VKLERRWIHILAHPSVHPFAPDLSQSSSLAGSMPGGGLGGGGNGRGGRGRGFGGGGGSAPVVTPDSTRK
jgi:hypothetical protein